MKHTDYWSQKTNPESGAWFEYEKQCLEAAHNGKADIGALLKTEYGRALTEDYLLKYRFDAPSKQADEYLASFGVRKELHDDGNYYSRWAMFLPDNIERCKKYPLIVVNAFNIEQGQFEYGFYKLCRQEQFLYMIPQNTNWESVSELIETVCDMYPADRERVYITGYSYNGYQAAGAFMHCPWKFAAAAPCGNDIFRASDNFQKPYTADELAALRHLTVPFMQIVGQYEASSFVPLNDWHVRAHWGNPKRPEELPEKYKDPRANQFLDPTINPIRKRPDGTIQNTPPSAMPAPPEGMDRHIWSLNRLNMRLNLLKCAPRNMEKCISFLDTPEDELHHVLGFYGDKEKIETIGGLKYYFADIYNEDGINAFRYVVIENHPHTTPAGSAKLLWDFFKSFRRDRATGRIIADEYKGAE